MTVHITCRPEEFLDQGPKTTMANRAEGGVHQPEIDVENKDITVDSDSDNDLFVNTNRPPPQSVDSHSSDSS